MNALSGTLGILATLAALAGPGPLAAQTAPPPSAAMLRRLAEAVDAQRDGQRVWVVIDTAAPFSVHGVFHVADEAALVGRRAHAAVMGPFVQPPDSGLSTPLMAILPCPGRHDNLSHCPDTTLSARVGALSIPVQNVDSISISIFGRTPGGTIHQTFKPEELDALFLTLSAIDKFVIPYYTRLYGPMYAAQMRAAYVHQLTGAH
ncbi:MAG TPA: hypothetical protein VMC86_05955 [Gemmatimonadales bacterium]|nr:hypothetical protein [Gemmatimonadales bacterium]